MQHSHRTTTAHEEASDGHQQGLYRPEFEHDACGIGALAHLKGTRSHQMIDDALSVLVNLEHRGGKGLERNTGDGAGILFQIPHTFFRKEAQRCGHLLPDEGNYAVAMVFFPQDEGGIDLAKRIFENGCASAGVPLLFWRKVPTDSHEIGATALACMPTILQAFLQRPEQCSSPQDFERTLYICRRTIEKAAQANHALGKRIFYICSMSSRTIVYKGMLVATQMRRFFLDLSDGAVKTSIALVHSRYSTNTTPSWERAHPNRYLIHNGEINTLHGNVNWIYAREPNMYSPVMGQRIKEVLPIINQEGSDSAILDNVFEFLINNGRDMSRAISFLLPEPWDKNPALKTRRRAFDEYQSILMEAWDGPAALAYTDGISLGAALDRNGLRPARYYVTRDDRFILSSEVGTLEIDPANILMSGCLGPGEMIEVDSNTRRVILNDEIRDRYAAEQPYSQWLREKLIKADDLEMPFNIDELLTGAMKNDKSSAGAPIAQSPSGGALPQTIEAGSQHTAVPQGIIEAHQNWLNVSPVTRLAKLAIHYDDIDEVLRPMAENAQTPLASMGIDAPLACLSRKHRSFFDYFYQLFAQVTNPPIDALRESLVTSSILYVGNHGNLLEDSQNNCAVIRLDSPLLTQERFLRIASIRRVGFKVQYFKAAFQRAQGENALEKALEKLGNEVEAAVRKGTNIVILSDRAGAGEIPIPSLLAVSSVHNHLLRAGQRTKTDLIVETGDALSAHDCAALVAYSASGIYPYAAHEIIAESIARGIFKLEGMPDFSKNTKHVGSAKAGASRKKTHAQESGALRDAVAKAIDNYNTAATAGIISIMSKMGISTLQSYHSAQIFEIVGLAENFVKKHFTRTVSRIAGMDAAALANELIARYDDACALPKEKSPLALPSLGLTKWRPIDGEDHLLNPQSIYLLQRACQQGDYETFKNYSDNIHRAGRSVRLRDLLDFAPLEGRKALPLEEVESVESIVTRFNTGAMSYGSLSLEAHECMAIAMNRLHGRSNSGEGGEDPRRETPLENGDSLNSAIKQVASGRFGVTSRYLNSAKEIQIKMAQGAKPGEGGHLPGKKVYPWIAEVRRSTPGIGLISPPPHHDIYSIEDLAQLIFDLKNANPKARISVKLVSLAGVGTIATGVAKGLADKILISGHNGGSGAAPRDSIWHAGLPLELGLAETQQTLLQNGLRSRVVLEADGKLMDGTDVAVACLLGAEEFGFATMPLIAMGCLMQRDCQQDSCPAGIATQNCRLREGFRGKPEYVENFMRFVAQQLREVMARLGFATVEEMVGHTECLHQIEIEGHAKANSIDLSAVLKPARCEFGSDIAGAQIAHYAPEMAADAELDKTLDATLFVPYSAHARAHLLPIHFSADISNVNRCVGTLLGNAVTSAHALGLPENSLVIDCKGSAGQSFGAFIPRGITLNVEGDANDYFGKGLSGGILSVFPPKGASFVAHENIIVGNVAFYGATAGRGFCSGRAGQRFAVRNSGATLVAEGVGNHGCEYMTGGVALILGEVGQNFAAGMTGGIAYVFDEYETLGLRCNHALVNLKEPSESELAFIRSLIEEHVSYTASPRGIKMLYQFRQIAPRFVKVIPDEYERVQAIVAQSLELGKTQQEAQEAAFNFVNRGNTHG